MNCERGERRKKHPGVFAMTTSIPLHKSFNGSSNSEEEKLHMSSLRVLLSGEEKGD